VRTHNAINAAVSKPEDDPDYEARKERQAKAFAEVRAEREGAAKQAQSK
jgi:hypothetical protein